MVNMVVRQLIQKYDTIDKKYRIIWRAVVSSGWNALIGAGKVLVGLVFFSPWYVVNGIYYLILCAARGSAIRTSLHLYDRERTQLSYEQECHIYHHSGIFVGGLGFSYLLISIRMFFRGDVTRFPDYAVFAVVIGSLAKLGSSIYGAFYDRKSASPVVRVVRILSLADAGVSLVMTRCALLLIVDAPNAVSNSAIFGMIVSTVLMLTGLWMWRRTLQGEERSG